MTDATIRKAGIGLATAALALALANPVFGQETVQLDGDRVAIYNIRGDGLFDNDPGRQAALERIFQAIDAPVWIISEVWDHSANEVRDQVEVLLPSGPGESWSAVKRRCSASEPGVGSPHESSNPETTARAAKWGRNEDRRSKRGTKASIYRAA